MPDDPQPLDYADPQVGRYVVIARFLDEAVARMAASRLDADDLHPLVDTRIHSYGKRSAKLSVLADEVGRAVEILKQTPARANLVDL